MGDIHTVVVCADGSARTYPKQRRSSQAQAQLAMRERGETIHIAATKARKMRGSLKPDRRQYRNASSQNLALRRQATIVPHTMGPRMRSASKGSLKGAADIFV
jgi:hypothetical protein